MGKHRKWPLYLIIAVILLTTYNILPTLFFYSKPLSAPINEKRASIIAKDLFNRVNSLEEESTSWLNSFCELLKINPAKIALNPHQPHLISIECHTLQEANRLRSFLPRAGALIPFVPAQLTLHDPEATTDKTVVIERKIPIHFDVHTPQRYSQFSLKFDANEQPTPLYRSLIEDRALQIAMAIAGPSENTLIVQSIIAQTGQEGAAELAIELAQNITSFIKAYPESSPITSRYFASYSRIEGHDRASLITKLLSSLETIKAEFKKEKEATLSDTEIATFLKEQRTETLNRQESLLAEAITIIRKNQKSFTSSLPPQHFGSLNSVLEKNGAASIQRLSLAGYSPFIESLDIDWKNEKIILHPYPEVASVRAKLSQLAHRSSTADLADALTYKELASIGRHAQETISPRGNQFEITLNQLENSRSFLALSLGTIANSQLTDIKETLLHAWHPEHPDLMAAAFPIHDHESYRQLTPAEQQFGLVLYSPALGKGAPARGFRTGSLYIIAKGLAKIVERGQQEGSSQLTHALHHDLNTLSQILQRNGFFKHGAVEPLFGSEFQSDMIFECPNYYQNVLGASRELFEVHGTRRYAILEFSNVEQRILTENQIDTQIHEDLLKARDDYFAAQMGTRGVSTFDVPKPTKSALWSNVKLSAIKYFRGDDRKILKWGLDLSGGKTVQIELKGTDHKTVTNPLDIKQGINELYKRVNKMGVSEVSIRQEGNFIALDFPGSQNLSASDLVKASKMFFHVVNEKFSSYNTSLKHAVDQFLQDVWNEAVVTGRQEVQEINRIAFKHLHGESNYTEQAMPLTDAAKLLYNSGLRLAHPDENFPSSDYDTTYSTIAVFRGEDFTEWQGQTHPLLVVFHNFVLEGSDLENIHASYDPSKGNFLSFGVKGSYTTREGHSVNPSETLYTWTSFYSKEKIAGSPLETYSHGRGWRMAVILNGSIISAPTLDSALRDSAMISGSFTQREISQLETDLKAGSLSFTPYIVSEQNVSPELGAKERYHGILATALSLSLVVIVMIGYYQFGGLIASIAVLFNLLIMWATLQNLQATLTLPGIAGIILTLAMAVDANVLVFERIREEFNATGRIAQAIHAGYRKALSAIIDSNVTTIIAALILLQFDSGPIKALAIMLLIGIISSLFTALFMTRFFFTEWVKNPKHTALHMRNWIKAQHYNFLKHTKKIVILSAMIVVIGSILLLKERHTLFGMDFRGGYALTVELQPRDSSYRVLVEQALIEQGVSPQDVQVRELSPSNHVRILLSHNLKERGKPFYGMPLENHLKEPTYLYELNPRIVWVVNALTKAGLPLDSLSLKNLDQHWSEISGQMSDTMRNSALTGLSIALLCILVYITLRFEFKYAVSATLCLAHDILFTLAALALLHACGIPIQIDLNTVAAMMTIIGYSLNDTIIVFDRIREEMKVMRKRSLTEIINHALNVTLGRTLMTSGTTLLVLIPLILLGGPTLFGFALVLSIGVIFGTLSSLFIAAPLMKYFHDKDRSVLLSVQRQIKD